MKKKVKNESSWLGWNLFIERHRSETVASEKQIFLDGAVKISTLSVGERSQSRSSEWSIGVISVVSHWFRCEREEWVRDCRKRKMQSVI